MASTVEERGSMASIVRNPVTNKFDVVSQTGSVLSTFATMDAAVTRKEQLNAPKG